VTPVRKGLAVLLLLGSTATATAAPSLEVGSKRFTESYILGEIVSQAARSAGEASVTHRRGLGNTAILLQALQSGSIDVYPEYTGTIAREILGLADVPPLAELNRRLAPMGLGVATPLGFNDTYALAMRAAEATSRHVDRISALKGQPDLRLGLSPEFLGRSDGWPGLSRAYGLEAMRPRAIEHGLAYEAIAGGEIDLMDAYSTDAKIDRYQLKVLDDDAHFFPPYAAVLLIRLELPQRLPRSWSAIDALAGRIDEATMRRLNAQAENDQRDFPSIAAGWLAGIGVGSNPPAQPAAARRGGWQALWTQLIAPDFGRLLVEQLTLVFASLAASCAVGIPLGLLAARRPRVGRFVFGVVGVIQTIPSLALLAFLIPLTGRIGPLPAFIALSLYALLPIVRNTHTGLVQIPHGLLEAAAALALRPLVILLRVELPLARPSLLAGIKTSAVINVGTATIAALIGAGGFGERIVTGLALNDEATLLAGAIPVALLALLIDGGFDLLERRLSPLAATTDLNSKR
jgi:osmoprotectant transport system permease protein